MERHKVKREKALPARVKRMNRSARLQSARSWLKTRSSGQNIVSGYRQHFAIDWLCAIKELEMLGVTIDSEYKNKLLKSLTGSVARRRKKPRRKEALDGRIDQDQTFAYIAGYTEAGFAYGVTWEEWQRLGENSINPEADTSTTTTIDGGPQDIPF